LVFEIIRAGNNVKTIKGGMAWSKPANYGGAVAWDDEDPSIDALHLKMLSDE
jgi:hypothetical protein